MIKLNSWYEDKGSIKTIKLDAHWCSNEGDRGIEVKLPDSPDGRLHSVYLPLKDILALLGLI